MRHFKKIFIFTFFSIQLQLLAQIPQADELVNINAVTTAEMNTILNPIEGSLIYNTTEKATYQRTYNSWVQLGKSRRVRVGQFIISTTGTQNITDVPFLSSNIAFHAYANIESTDINDDNDSGLNNSNTIANAFHSITGYARNDSGTITQQVIGVGGNGTSINDISRYSNSTKCIGIRYGNQNGDILGVTSASLTSFKANGFTINVDSRADNLLVIYTAYG